MSFNKKNLSHQLRTAICGLLVGFAAFAAGCALSGTPKDAVAAPQQAVTTSSGAKLSPARDTPVVRAARTVGPAVVGITNKAVARDWFNNQIQVEQGVGSGVIFKADGYIVTNNHVIEGAKEIIVSLSDGRTVNGKLIGADPLTDIAVVKIDAKDLTAAPFGNSDEIVVGEPAIAIGNPLGLEFQGSVTTGVISALNRTLDISDKRLKLLQTDAAISPGNSGGALVNADGEVIGINSAKMAASGVEGMGFAIPINTVQEIIGQLLDKGYVIRPYLGVSVFDKASAARQGYRLNAEHGVYVQAVTLRGPADRAGIQHGDLILSIDGTATDTFTDLRNAISEHKVGDTIKITIDRNGNKLELEAKLEEIPRND